MEPVEAWLYDGRVALRRAVTVRLDGALFQLNGEVRDAVPLAELSAVGDRARPVFARRGHDGWRLGFDAPLPDAWAGVLPRQEHHGGIIDRIGLVPALLGALVIAGAVLLALGPATRFAARSVPESWEVALGEGFSGDYFGRACRGEAGNRALQGLSRRLSRDGRPIAILVIDAPVVNAVTLPGRRVILFEGLIDKAASPDEVAGVLAHELGHVANRDAMTALIRGIGISVLIGGADAGAITQALLAARYSRATERDADAFAMAALAGAGVSPAPTAAFFQRLAERETVGGSAAAVINWIESHPLSAERRQAFTNSLDPKARYRPALSTAEWQAVRAMCKAKKD